MRIEATIPDSRGKTIDKLAQELGLSRSQLVDEALALFLKAILEVKRGNRVVTVDPARPEIVVELSSPSLTALEWAARAQKAANQPAEKAPRPEPASRATVPGSSTVRRIRDTVKRFGRK